MPLMKDRPWHVTNAVKDACRYLFLTSFLFHHLVLGQDNATSWTFAEFQDSDNGSSACIDPGGILYGHRKPMYRENLYFRNGTELQFICHSDYVFILGDGVITCVSGQWLPPKKPRCIHYRLGDNRSYCTQPPYTPYSVLNTVAYKEYDIGTTLYFDCLQGYQVEGSHMITCGEDGKWYPSPKCRPVHLWLKDIENRSSSLDTPALKSETTSIMKIISYLAVPVLIGFLIAILLNLKSHTCLQLTSRPARGPQDTLDSIARGGGSNTLPGNIANLRLSFQHYMRPFRPPSYPYHPNSNVYSVSSQVPEMGLPTYEEAIKDSNPPSFDVACGLDSSTAHQASPNDPSKETSSVHAPVEINRSRNA